jgi:hypothetical protein
MGEKWTRDILAEREKIIRLENEDAYRYGYYLTCWHDADELLKTKMCVCIFGGNGAGKSFYLARKGVETMVTKPGSKVLWLSESESSSIMILQSAVWRYLPREYRVPMTKRSRIRNINYSVANGFSDNRFVLPNGSIGRFGAYKQDLSDYEGTGWTLIPCDEDLPLGWLKTLMIRLPRCNGQIIWGYTPLHGITPAIRHITDGAVTEKSLPAPLLNPNKKYVDDCPKGHMPYIQRSIWGDVGIIYFLSSMNPYGNYEGFVKTVERFPEEDIVRRAYGFARNTISAILPKFSAAHIIAPDKITKKVVTLRHYADPAGARNMFMLWVATDQDNRRFVYREWPDYPTYGEWAVTSEDSKRWDGDPGPAQPSLGYGVIDYKRIILEAEGAKWDGHHWDMSGAEKIFERYMDPRSGAAQVITEDSGTSIMDLFLDDQQDKNGHVVGPSLDFVAAPGVHEDQGIMAINDLLSYDKETPLCPILNEPHLYVSSECKNLIWAMKTYTRHDGEKAACKDPIDCLRYLATSDSDWVDEEALKSYGGGSYGSSRRPSQIGRLIPI